MHMPFTSQVGGININFDAIPDLQPQAIRGLIKTQKLPEENVLGQVIQTVPVADKLFKARIDDGIDTSMTPEVSMNADDPMVGDNWRWRSDQVNEYRQAAKINREVGEQLLALDGTPNRYAGQAQLNRLIGRITTAIDNRREYNRALAIENAFLFDPVRTAVLKKHNCMKIATSKEKWDNAEKDVKGNRIVQPFEVIGAVANRLSFISGKNPDSIVVTPDVLTALENHDKAGTELKPPTKAGARYFCRNMNIYVSQGKKNIGTDEKPVLVPLFQNMCIICSLDEETIAENQYDINRVEQFTTADRLFYYVRYWHKSKVHVSRPINFYFIEDVLANPYTFEDVASLMR